MLFSSEPFLENSSFDSPTDLVVLDVYLAVFRVSRAVQRSVARMKRSSLPCAELEKAILHLSILS